MALTSTLCAFAALLPPRGGYRLPISLQFARGEPLAWMMFFLIGATVLAAVPTLVRAKRYLSGTTCVLTASAIWILATTDPRSHLHLSVFIYLAALILFWLWSLWATLQDGRILATACVATLGALSCLLSFGIGERIMLLSSLTALNVLLLSDLLE